MTASSKDECEEDESEEDHIKLVEEDFGGERCGSGAKAR